VGSSPTSARCVRRPCVRLHKVAALRELATRPVSANTAENVSALASWVHPLGHGIAGDRALAWRGLIGIAFI
jgi:hypothetical protein